jgi:S1-C subfamily serine protease
MSEIDKIRVYKALLYAIDPTRDLAIVFFISEKANYTADLDLEDKLYIGDEVLEFGCGWKEPPRLSCGKITSLIGSKTFGNGLDYFRHSTYTLHGDSGAGIFRDYKLIGIASAIRAESPINVANEMSYAVNIRQFKKWNEKEKNAYSFIHTKDPIPKIPTLELEFNKNKNDIIKE